MKSLQYGNENWGELCLIIKLCHKRHNKLHFFKTKYHFLFLSQIKKLIKKISKSDFKILSVFIIKLWKNTIKNMQYSTTVLKFWGFPVKLDHFLSIDSNVCGQGALLNSGMLNSVKNLKQAPELKWLHFGWNVIWYS